jgi:hypothetical protein
MADSDQQWKNYYGDMYERYANAESGDELVALQKEGSANVRAEMGYDETEPQRIARIDQPGARQALEKQLHANQAIRDTYNKKLAELSQVEVMQARCNATYRRRNTAIESPECVPYWTPDRRLPVNHPMYNMTPPGQYSQPIYDSRSQIPQRREVVTLIDEPTGPVVKSQEPKKGGSWKGILLLVVGGGALVGGYEAWKHRDKIKSWVRRNGG